MLTTFCRFAATAALISATSVLAQPAPPVPQPAPALLSDALGVEIATVQYLQAPKVRVRTEMTLWINGQVVTLDLLPNDVRSSSFRLYESDEDGLHLLPTPPSVTWRGTVVDRPGSLVSASILNDGLHAQVWLAEGGAAYAIQPSRSLDPSRPVTEHLVYATTDMKALPVHCGTDHRPSQAATVGQLAAPAANTRKVCEIAIDCDRDYYLRFSSNSVAVQNQVTTILNGVDAIYQTTIDIEYELSTLIIRTSKTYLKTDMSDLLVEFRNRWNSNHGSVQRDVAHLFTGKGNFNGTIGITWGGVICDLAWAYGVDQAYSGTTSVNVALVSHELGHDWNAPHCDTQSDCRIMCATLSGCSGLITSFGTSSTSTMQSFKNSRSCLHDPDPPVITSLTPDSAQAFAPGSVTVNGENFGAATQVLVGGQSVVFQAVDSTRIRLNPPRPSTLGPASIQVASSTGVSDSATLTYLETDPPQFTGPALSAAGQTMNYRLGGRPQDAWWILVSFTNATTPVLGWDLINDFQVFSLGQLDTAGLDNFDFPVPAYLSLAGMQIYAQAVHIAPDKFEVHEVSIPIGTIFL